MSLTKEDLVNIQALIARAPITGEQAALVVNLQLKLRSMLQELDQPKGPTPPPDEPK